MPTAPPYQNGNLAGTRVSRETWERLEDYSFHLERWTQTINLVAQSGREHLWQRHVIDSAQLWPFRHPETQIWADLGTGGGLPGLVLAIMAHELSPRMRFHLVESDQRKAAFLRFIESRQNLGVVLHAGRIEKIPPLRAQTVSARALAPLPLLLGLVARHLAPGGTAVLPKGLNFPQEKREAEKTWSFSCLRHGSLVDSQAAILQIRDIQPRREPTS